MHVTFDSVVDISVIDSDCHEILYEHHAIGDLPVLVFFNSLQ